MDRRESGESGRSESGVLTLGSVVVADSVTGLDELLKPRLSNQDAPPTRTCSISPSLEESRGSP
jgi:hypothetical protein